MELEKRATVHNAEIFSVTDPGPKTSQSERKQSDGSQKICRTESGVSFSSSSFSTETKDSKMTTKDLSSSSTSQATDMAQEASPRESMKQALKSEKAFIDYVMSLPSAEPSTKEPSEVVKTERQPSIRPKHKSSFTTTNTTNTTKVGLDHLDNLCKLMEQLSELRDTNTKLQKRVQYLEDLKTLHEMHKEIRQEIQYGSENVLTQRHPFGLKKSLTSTDYVKDSLRGSKDYAGCSPRASEDYCCKEQRATKSVRSPSGRRSRVLDNPPYDGHRRERSKSVGHEEAFDGKPKRIFPKWSKVKEAFGWESDRKNSGKTSKFYLGTSTGTTRNDEPYLGNRRLFNEPDSTTMKLPFQYDYSEKDEISCIDTYAGEAMAAAAEESIPPFNSSTEDIAMLFENYQAGSYLKPKSSTIERDMDPEQAFVKFAKEESKKAHKSPWGRVKTIIERRRDSLKRRHLRRDAPMVLPESRYRDATTAEDVEYDLQYATFDSHRKSSDDQFISHSCITKNESGYIDELDKLNKRKNALQTKDVNMDKMQPIATVLQLNAGDIVDNRNPCNQDREVIFRTPDSSPQLQRKSTWMKMKNVLRNKKEGETTPILGSQSMPSSPNGVHDGTFDFEDTEVLESNLEEPVSFERVHEISRVGSDSNVHELSLSTTPPVSDIMLKLQRNISDDFNRKMKEWERIRNSGIRSTTSPKWERKNSSSKSRKKADKTKIERFEKTAKAKIKDLAWLEKELQKIEKEKQRLSKEKEKYEERAVRLERLRQTVLTARNSHKKEVLVRTSAGEFRFEGISDAFTKKLYEWETKRGLGPEFSTIALLDSSLKTTNKNCLAIQQMDKCGNLQRALSRSESSIAEIGQPSHTSSNSLPSLKPPDIGELERIHHHSRANSEPDLSSFIGIGNNSSCQNTFTQKNGLTAESSRDTLGAEARESYAHPEVTRLIDSDVEEALGEIENQRQEQREENYYSLLEENVILLEQLKNKEEICRRLEKELELLDDKVEEMNKHHQQEMECYREKLWEMHKPGSTPREVQGCLNVMAQLRARIENLEDCSEKLKNEKETLEDSFRFHSAEQEHMTLDLLDKMRELHEAGADGKKRGVSKEYSPANFNIKIVERLQDLSSQLVKQTQDLEQALAERTRQICQLRWELLHRDVSTVKLETELHSAQMQSTTAIQNHSAWDNKRSKYAHFRSWSSEEASSRSRQLQECGQQSKKRIKAENMKESYYKLPKTEFQTSKLSNTVHELNRELIRLSTAAETFLNTDGNKNDSTASQSKGNEVVTWIAPEDASTGLGKSVGDILSVENRKSDVRNSKISVRRNSVGSISTASGIDPVGSESSSVNGEIRNSVMTKSSPKLYRKIPPKVSWTDSESSSGEDDFTKVSFTSRPSDMLWEPKPEINFKQSSSKRKVYHDQDGDDKTAICANAQLCSMLKKRNSYKLMKNNRKSYRTDVIPNKQSSSTQSESDPAISTRISPRDCSYRTSNTEGSITLSKNMNTTFLWSEKPMDSLISKIDMHLKPESLIKKNGQKDLSNRLNKSHPMRAAASDSKIPKSNRTIIRKSESCHERKKSTESSSICKENLQISRKFVDVNKMRQGSVKEKNSPNNKATPIIQTSISKSSAQQSDIVDTEAKMTPPQISVKRKLFALQKETILDSESKTKKNDSDDSDEACEKQNWVVKGKEKMDHKLSKEVQGSPYLLRCPKRKAKESHSTDGSSSEPPHSNTSDRDSLQTTSEETVTVTIPRRRKPSQASNSTKTCEENFTLKKKEWTPDLLKQETVSMMEKFTQCETTSDQWCKQQEIETNDMTHYNKGISQEHRIANVNNPACFENIKINGKSPIYVNIKPNISQIAKPNCQFEEKIASPHRNTARKNFELGTKQLNENETLIEDKKNSSYLKSPSAPQLDWKKGCAKKISSQGAPNVKTLIEKYNQKVLETQLPKSPCSSTYNSPAVPRKISAPQERELDIKVTPFSSTPSTPKFITASTFYNPLVFKPADLNLFQRSIDSTPTSPNLKVRSKALLEAKEKFISSSNIVSITTNNLQNCENNEITEMCKELKPTKQNNTTQRSATDSEINRKQRYDMQKMSMWDEENNRKSICSNKSSDSMNIVLYKTGETCQESRLSKRFEKQKLSENQSKVPENIMCFKASKSLSNSSIFKSVTGYELKLPSSFLRLRRSRKKKDMSTVSELCRQSLLLNDESSHLNVEDIVKSPRSCPSSPELKCKNKAKTSWFQRSLFKLK